jgi:hypothetical protein
MSRYKINFTQLLNIIFKSSLGWKWERRRPADRGVYRRRARPRQLLSSYFEAQNKHRLWPRASSLIKKETLAFERKRGMDSYLKEKNLTGSTG